jgi:hypothetical protein
VQAASPNSILKSGAITRARFKVIHTADSMIDWVCGSLLANRGSLDDANVGATFGATLYLNSVHFAATLCS